VNNFLNLSRLENNMVEIKLVKTDICSIINNCIELQTGIASSKNIKIILEKTGPAFVMADPKQLLIVLNNLIGNALKYSFENSEIIITIKTENNMQTISVKDFGLGIPEDEVDLIFEKFFRSRNNKEGNIEGTGLGLSIIKTIIDKHGGNIQVESKENEGSTFSFSLPVA
ncbi:MAG: HAMP domain-containing sensor histidine kinase, partial [Cyanobacteriota bacterium]